MKTLIKMITLGVLMASGMVIAEGDSGDHYDQGSFNFTENQNADINSVINGGTNYGDVQGAQNTYNCDVAGACSGSSISGGGSSNGGGNYSGGSTTNLLTDEDLANGYAYVDSSHIVYSQGAEIMKFVYENGTEEVGYKPLYQDYTYQVQLLDGGNPVYVVVNGKNTDEVVMVNKTVTHTIAGTSANNGGVIYNQVKIVDNGTDSGFKETGSGKYETDSETVDDPKVQIGKNSLDVQLEISRNQKDTTITQTVLSAPPVSAPQINANNADMCRTGISAGGSVVGMGFSAGITLVDKNCEMIKMVRLLNNLGLKDVALALLGQDSRVAAAMLQANAEYYGKFLSGTTRDLEAESNAAETAANGKVIEHDVIDEDTPSAEGFNLIDLLTAK